MKIQISIGYIIYLLVIIYLGYLQWYMMFLLCICVHELGHMLIGIAYGNKIGTIKVNINGIGVMYKKDFLTGKKRFFMLMGGPTANLIMAMICIKEPYIFLCNIMLFCFNILPIYPLDGAQILNEFFFLHKKLIENITLVMLIMFICIISINFSNNLLLIWGIYVLSFCRNIKENKIKC